MNEKDTRIAMIAIAVEDRDISQELNEILHDFGQYIIGRMGIPYREKKVNLISVAVDAPQDIISSLTGKIGNLEGVTVSTAYAKKHA
jgi:putative iron-only hydrogenase system regulator